MSVDELKKQYKDLKKQFHSVIRENLVLKQKVLDAEQQLMIVSNDKDVLLEKLSEFEKVSASSDSCSSSPPPEIESVLENGPPALSLCNFESAAFKLQNRSKKPTLESKVVKALAKTPLVPKTPASCMRDKPSSSIVSTSTLTPSLSLTTKTSTPVANFKSAPKANELSTAITTSTAAYTLHDENQMTAEEVEKHLQSRTNYLQFVAENTPTSVPLDVFNSENENF